MALLLSPEVVEALVSGGLQGQVEGRRPEPLELGRKMPGADWVPREENSEALTGGEGVRKDSV